MINSKIFVETKTIKQVVANVASKSYGVVGLSSKSSFIEGMNRMLNIAKVEQGVDVLTDENSDLIINVRVFVNNGLPIKQVVNSLTNKIKFELEQYDIVIEELNVFVMGVR